MIEKAQEYRQGLCHCGSELAFPFSLRWADEVSCSACNGVTTVITAIVRRNAADHLARHSAPVPE